MLALLLAARDRLHHFVRSLLTAPELNDIILFSAMALIVLPMAVRSLGPRRGLPLAGFMVGFVSSTATMHSMGERVSRQPPRMSGAVAGVVL